MTADVNFDFQSRPVIITRAAWPPGICIIGSGALALNPEHRRANSKIFPVSKELLAQRHTQTLDKLRFQAAMRRVRFFLGQSSIACSISQTAGNRFLVQRHLFTQRIHKEIEQSNVDQKRFVGGSKRIKYGLVFQFPIGKKSHVSRHGRETIQRFVTELLQCFARFQSKFGHQNGIARSNLFCQAPDGVARFCPLGIPPRSIIPQRSGAKLVGCSRTKIKSLESAVFKIPFRSNRSKVAAS